MQYINPQIEFCLENQSSLFRGLSPREKEAIVQHHSISRIKKGDFLFRENERYRGVICLVSGKAKVFRIGIGGREHIIRLLRAGDLTGLQTLFTETTWSASSIAIEDSMICTIEKHCISRILKSNADLAVRFSRQLAEELTYSYDKMVSLTQKHVRGRLVESLLMLADIYGFEADGKTIKAGLSRNDIAHLSNMTTSNAIRTLSNLSAEGNIRVKGRKITLLNLPNLEKISGQA